MAARRPTLVVEDDSALRFIGVILSTDVDPERIAAFQDFFAHDLPDFEGWLSALRKRLPALYPADIQFVADDAGLKAALPHADALVVESCPVGAAEIAAAPRLRAVQKFGTIITDIDQHACAARNIRLLTLRRRANVACAEHALALMLALARKICDTNGLTNYARLRAAGYAPKPLNRAHTANSNWARIGGIRTLFGAKLGIFGLGEIGREVALRAASCGMKIAYTQRHRLAADDEARYQASYATLDTLLAESNFICLHLPGNPATKGILGARELTLIKPGAMLINTSRAELVDRDALMNALATGRLGGYATDLPFEEPGRDDDPLLGLRNVIVTPHIAAQPRFNFLADFEDMMINLEHVL